MSSTKASVSCSIFGCQKRMKPAHHFPNPSIYPARFIAWVRATGNPRFNSLAPATIFKRGFICDHHFEDCDHVAGSKRLKKEAVPSINLPSGVTEIEASSSGQIDLSPSTAKYEHLEEQFRTPQPEMFSSGTPRMRVTPECSKPLQTEKKTTKTSRKTLEFQEFMPEAVMSEAGASQWAVEGVGELEQSSNQVEVHNYEVRRKKSSILKRIGVKRKQVVTNDMQRKLYTEAQRLQKRVSRSNVKLQTTKAALKRATHYRESYLSNLFQRFTPIQRRFFESQFRNVQRKPRGRTFTMEDKADAIALWKSGPKSYRLLSKMFALPSINILRRTLNKVPLEPGISKPMFQVLKKRVDRMKLQKQKFCVLLFDEIAVQPHLDYLPHEDRVIGFEDDGSTRSRNVADHVCVFMLRGIFNKWKQPVAYAFCKSSMKSQSIVRFYKEIIKSAAEIGLNVIASICDQGTNNVKAIDTLLEQTKRNAIIKGEEVKDNLIIIDGHQVIPLFDPPHLMKSIRNNLLTKNVHFTQNGETFLAKWSHIVDAYHLDQSSKGYGFRGMTKLTEFHVLPGKIRKMKVSLCSQVFSNSVASFINFCAGASGPAFRRNSLPKESVGTAKLLLFLDSIFDSVNGGFGEKNQGKVLRGFVGRNTRHLRIWLEGKRIFSNMKFVRSKPGDRLRPPCLSGWYRTLDGFILIKQTLQKYGYFSFPARAFNQDPLENFFGQIRQYGVRYINPTCKSFVPFFKSLLIRSFSSYHPRGSNCEKDEVSPLVTIRDFLSLEIENDYQVEVESWKPPTLPSVEVDYFEKNALSYVSGFVIKHISPEKYNCDVCLRNLMHFGEPDELQHKLVVMREFDENKRLKYININLLVTLLEMYSQIKILVPSAIYFLQIKRKIIDHLRPIIHFNFEGCPHSEQVITQIFNIFINIYIHGYMKSLSNIVLGKETPQNSTDLEAEMRQLYLRRRQK